VFTQTQGKASWNYIGCVSIGSNAVVYLWRFFFLQENPSRDGFPEHGLDFAGLAG
jgi:hypothetical protein